MEPARIPVPPLKKLPFVEYDAYKPEFYDNPCRNGKPWADQASALPSIAFNTNTDGLVRESYTGPYALYPDNTPRNPVERTGATGPWSLGRYGPNHAADAVATFSRNGKIYAACVTRKDNGKKAFPGGFVDPNDGPLGASIEKKAKAAAARELDEETQNNIPADDRKAFVDHFSANGCIVFKGYMPDTRQARAAIIFIMLYPHRIGI